MIVRKKQLLVQTVRALIALAFCFEILLGYFWPCAVLAQPRVIITDESEQAEQNENKSSGEKISCSISEKYSIVYSYNTVLGEEPDLKIVNLLCIALKKKKRAVVFESVVNYMKTILEKNDNLRLKAGINAFNSVLSQDPDEEQLKLVNQIVFGDGQVYSYSELKILFDLNKDRFIEIAKQKSDMNEKDFELAKKDTKEIEKPKIEKVHKALAEGPSGMILNSGFCTNLSTQPLTEISVSSTRDGILSYLENEIDVTTGYGDITLDTTEIGTVDSNTISAVTKFRGANNLNLFSGIINNSINQQNINTGATLGANPFINSTTFPSQKVQSASQGVTLDLFTSSKQQESQEIPFGNVTNVNGSTVTTQNINITGTSDIQLGNSNNVIALASLPDNTDTTIALIRAKENSGQDVEALGTVQNTSGGYSISFDVDDLFNITAKTNNQVIVHNFIHIPKKTVRTEASQKFEDITIGTLGFIHDRTENLEKLGELSASTNLNAFNGFTIFDFDRSTSTFNMAYHFYGTDSTNTNSPSFVKKSLLSLNPLGGNYPFMGDEYISGIKTVTDPANPDDHYLLVSYYRQTTNSGALMFTPPPGSLSTTSAPEDSPEDKTSPKATPTPSTESIENLSEPFPS